MPLRKLIWSVPNWFQLIGDSTHCNETWLHFLYDNYCIIIVPWNAVKGVYNQLKCQPSGVIEFCPKKEKIEGVACSCMNVKYNICNYLLMQKQALKEAQEWVGQKLAMREKNLAAIGWSHSIYH